MTQLSASPRAVPQRPRRWCDIQAAEEVRIGRAELARRFRRNESSLRNWIRRNDNPVPGSPDFDDAAVLLARAPVAMFLDALQVLAGRRAIVCLVDNQGVPAGTQPRDVVKTLIQALAGFDALLQDTYERCGDGVVSPDDAAAIAQRGAAVRGLIEQVVRYAQHCAAQAGRHR